MGRDKIKILFGEETGLVGRALNLIRRGYYVVTAPTDRVIVEHRGRIIFGEGPACNYLDGLLQEK